ncbi:MAG: glycosyltransferase, partial [Pseudomonadales bacterium]|nr:glycosyltransferase [Pseudomonadales bacterium]
LEKENLISQTVRLGINDRVHFAGYCRNPFAWFACADAFVISSRYDGFPNALLEALALGTPVIATPSPGGTREILQGVANCVIAENVSPAALASAIEKWLNTGRKRVDPLAVKRYRQESVISEYENLFCHLLHG